MISDKSCCLFFFPMLIQSIASLCSGIISWDGGRGGVRLLWAQLSAATVVREFPPLCGIKFREPLLIVVACLSCLCVATFRRQELTWSAVPQSLGSLYGTMVLVFATSSLESAFNHHLITIFLHAHCIVGLSPLLTLHVQCQHLSPWTRKVWVKVGTN